MLRLYEPPARKPGLRFTARFDVERKVASKDDDSLSLSYSNTFLVQAARQIERKKCQEKAPGIEKKYVKRASARKHILTLSIKTGRKAQKRDEPESQRGIQKKRREEIENEIDWTNDVELSKMKDVLRRRRGEACEDDSLQER